MNAPRCQCSAQRPSPCRAPSAVSCRLSAPSPAAWPSQHSAACLRLPTGRHARRMCARATGDSTDGEDSTESLFEKELRKRGLSSSAVKADERESQGSSRGEQPMPLPEFRRAEQATADQLERSRKLNSEGLEGLIPRVTELVKLGGSFWVSFYPLIGLTIAAFIAVYLVSGTGFIHQGNERMSVPEYMDRSLFLEDEPAPATTAPDAEVAAEIA